MGVQLRWLASQSASCFHAVAALHQGFPFVDPAWNAALAEPAGVLLTELEHCQIPVERFLEHVVPLSSGIDNNRELVQVVGRKIHGSFDELTVQRLAGCIESVESAARRACPQMMEELGLRIGPLRAQWEARGPGLLRRFAELTEERLVVENADVILVQPALGGAGTAHLPYNSIRVEGVLVNPHPSLPEVLRMAWLIGQLQCDLPIFSETIARERLPYIAGLALVPPILLAAEHVELGRADVPTISLALQAWRVPGSHGPLPPTSPTPSAVPAVPDPIVPDPTVLLEWWDMYLITKPAWQVALSALDQLV